MKKSAYARRGMRLPPCVVAALLLPTLLTSTLSAKAVQPVNSNMRAVVTAAAGDGFVVRNGGKQAVIQSFNIPLDGLGLKTDDRIQTRPGSVMDARLLPGNNLIRFAENTSAHFGLPVNYKFSQIHGFSGVIMTASLEYGRVRVVNIWDGGLMSIHMGRSVVEITNGDVNIDYMIQAGSYEYHPALTVSVLQGTAVLIPDAASPAVDRIIVKQQEAITISEGKTERRLLNGSLEQYWDSVNRTFEYYNPTYRNVTYGPAFTSVPSTTTAQAAQGFRASNPAVTPKGSYANTTPAYSRAVSGGNYSTASPALPVSSLSQYGVSPAAPPVVNKTYMPHEYAEYQYDEERGTWYAGYVDNNDGFGGRARTISEDPFAGNPAQDLKPGMEMGFATPTEREFGVTTASSTPGPMMITPDGHLVHYYDPAKYAYYPAGDTFIPVEDDTKLKKKKK